MIWAWGFFAFFMNDIFIRLKTNKYDKWQLSLKNKKNKCKSIEENFFLEFFSSKLGLYFDKDLK
jgi:hypothetical protein